jgi:hypothetical protein
LPQPQPLPPIPPVNPPQPEPPAAVCDPALPPEGTATGGG